MRRDTHHLAFKPIILLLYSFPTIQVKPKSMGLGKCLFFEVFNHMNEAHYDYGEQSVCLKSADLLNF